MLEKYRPGVTLFSILTIIAVLFPPVTWERGTTIYDTGYSFILSIPKYHRLVNGEINFKLLFVELILIFAIALLFQLNYEKLRARIKNIF